MRDSRAIVHTQQQVVKESSISEKSRIEICSIEDVLYGEEFTICMEKNLLRH